MVFNISEHNSIANQFMSELRDVKAQTYRAKFRKNMERLGQIMAYEISKVLPFQPAEVITSLGTKHTSLMSEKPVIITVMRAGLPYFQGFVDYFDESDCGFIGAYRDEGTGEIRISLDYVAAPSIDGRIVVLIDPMLATGSSFIRAVNAITEYGTPGHIHIASVVASPQGIQFVEQNLKLPHTIWTCSLDDTLNSQFYIVPGLGDAGDLSYGEKI
ncbi:MAG: uracil phosphoribosyltransferase [Chryseolinea sp.]